MMSRLKERPMNKKVLLGAAISLASLHASAVPFQVLDARTMGMGGTGVASAPLSSAAVYNPALLSTVREDDHFTLNLRLGVYAGDEDEILDATDEFDPEAKSDELNDLLDENIAGSIPNNLDDLDTAVTGMTGAINDITAVVNRASAGTPNVGDDTLLLNANTQLQQSNANFQSATTDLDANAGSNGKLKEIVFDFTDYLDNTLSGARLKGGGALGFNIAIPSKKFAVGVGIDTNVSGSGRITVSRNDTGLLEDYATATAEMVTDGLTLGSDVSTLATDVGNLVTVLQDGSSTPQDIQNAANAVDVASVETQVTDFDNKTIVGQNSGETIIENGQIPDDQQEIDLESTIHVYGAAITDIGISISREFMVMDRAISFGITPKLQKVDVFDFIAEVDGEDPDEPEGSPNKEIDFDEVEFEDYHKEYSGTNLDIGAAHKFGYNERWQGGLVVKNLLSKSYKSERGQKVDIQPMVRAGLGYQNIDYWLKPKASIDLDLTENKATAFEDPTRYLALGGEIDLFRWIQLRAGYRTNLSGDDESIYSGGIGLSPFMIHMDLAVWTNTSSVNKEVGGAFELGVEF